MLLTAIGAEFGLVHCVVIGELERNAGFVFTDSSGRGIASCWICNRKMPAVTPALLKMARRTTPWLFSRRVVRRNADCFCENLGSELMIQPCNIKRLSSSK
jgi:hypothetical protein